MTAAGTVRISALAAMFVLVTASCGGDDGSARPSASPAATASSAATTATTATTASPTSLSEIVDGIDPDADAAAQAWTTVFDSTTPVEAKLAFLAEPEAHRSTLEAYAGAGQGVGGITLAPTAVEVEGDTAMITYEVRFAGNLAYGDQEGTLTRGPDGWVVPTEELCSFMAEARVPCS